MGVSVCVDVIVKLLLYFFFFFNYKANGIIVCAFSIL